MMLNVACAIVMNGENVLICQRSERMSLPLKWEFPGGKVEPDEDDAIAIVREIKEELHLDIEVLKRLVPVEHRYPAFRIRLIPFLAYVTGGKLRLEEHRDAKWVPVTELGGYDWAPADVPVVEWLTAQG